MIKKVAGGYRVLSEKGRNLGGPYKTQGSSRKEASPGRVLQAQEGMSEAVIRWTGSGQGPPRIRRGRDPGSNGEARSHALGGGLTEARFARSSG